MALLYRDHPVAIVCAVAVAALGGTVAVRAQSAVQAEAAVAKALAEGKLHELVATLAKSNTCEFVAQAMVNQDVPYDQAIAALLAAKLTGEEVSKCLYGAVAPSEFGALDGAMLAAGLPLPPTGAGPGTGGGAPPPAFVGPTIGGGGGGGTASPS
jgi:hypothetical protein